MLRGVRTIFPLHCCCKTHFQIDLVSHSVTIWAHWKKTLSAGDTSPAVAWTSYIYKLVFCFPLASLALMYCAVSVQFSKHSFLISPTLVLVVFFHMIPPPCPVFSCRTASYSYHFNFLYLWGNCLMFTAIQKIRCHIAVWHSLFLRTLSDLLLSFSKTSSTIPTWLWFFCIKLCYLLDKF